MMRFDRFTERAQDAAARAYEILQRYGHNQVDTEHILLALLEQPDGVIPQILEKLSVEQEQIKKRLDDVCAPAPKPPSTAAAPGRSLSPRASSGSSTWPTRKPTGSRTNTSPPSTSSSPSSRERNTAAARILAEAGITKERVYDTIKDLRGGQRVTDPQAETPLPHAGEILARPDPAGQGRQARPGHRPRPGDPARHPGVVAAAPRTTRC